MPCLIVPNSGVAYSVRAAAKTYGDDLMPAYGSEAADLTDSELEAYVETLLADAREETPRPLGHVPSTHLWWVDGHEFLGRVHIRHRLTPFLLESGGHLGYHVVPPWRRMGHASAMLAAALPIARAIGMDRLLITCDTTNVASKKVIGANGGILEDERGGKLRYWVPTW
ncbi:MAG: GNAT family N-acetyltransferase [Candidatus Dormibacteria bacterium]